MAPSKSRKNPSVFISHSSVNLKTARQVEAALQTAGFDAWLDRSDIHVGALLRSELQHAIKASHAVVLLWSKAAAASRWVAAEILTAFHLNRFIVPCVLSKTDLPPLLSRSVYFRLGGNRTDVLQRMTQQLAQAPRARNPWTTVNIYQSQDLSQTIQDLYGQQHTEMDQVERGDLVAAKKSHAKLDPAMLKAEKRWRFDPTILSLGGFHRKNGYMLKYWDENAAGRFPFDPLLEQGERLFFDTLLTNPVDFSALNGLGNILYFEGELDAAEFFVIKAIDYAAEAGINYTEAKNDLELIQSRRVELTPKLRSRRQASGR